MRARCSARGRRRFRKFVTAVGTLKVSSKHRLKVGVSVYLVEALSLLSGRSVVSGGRVAKTLRWGERIG